jgi:hypothetical protein
MKTFIRKAAIFTSLALTIAASSFTAAAQENKLIYSKTNNPAIGITINNATGASYSIKDKTGKVVLTGTVKNNKTFFIPTGNLAKGTYRFVMGSLVLQEFEIR